VSQGESQRDGIVTGMREVLDKEIDGERRLAIRSLHPSIARRRRERLRQDTGAWQFSTLPKRAHSQPAHVHERRGELIHTLVHKYVTSDVHAYDTCKAFMWQLAHATRGSRARVLNII
jgi:hypothetical protein